jgi:hypothetical protein
LGSASLQFQYGGRIEDVIVIQACIPKTWPRQPVRLSVAAY